jgi:hypothetical protein
MLRYRARRRTLAANRKLLAFSFSSWYDLRMSGVTFMVDSRGEKTAAVIDLRRHRKLWEDFCDTALVESRAKEPRESLDSVKRRLKLTKLDG